MSSSTGGVQRAIVHTQPRIRGLLPGEIVAGKYRVDRPLGAGGMGVIVVATDLQLKRQVAIKALTPMLAADERAVARFLREARAAVRLSGDHTVRVYDVGELPSGIPYIAMELLVGRDLAMLASGRGRLPFREAVDLILQAAEGVAEAHAFGIVHRDLKPANLFLTRRTDGSPLVKVLDFGLAKSPVGDGTKLTSPSAVMGTHHYMSPEQLRGSSDVDERTDIWALGVCLYELLTGKMPFRPPSSRDRRPGRGALEDLSRMIVFGQPKPAHELVADIPPDLSTAIARCLEKNPNDRFSNVADLAAALEPYGSVTARGSAARIERVLEEETVVTVDVTLNAGRRERGDSTTEKVERAPMPLALAPPAPLAPRPAHADRLRELARAARLPAERVLLVVRQVRQAVHRVRHPAPARRPSAWTTAVANGTHFLSCAIGAGGRALSVAVARVGGARRARTILAASALLIGLTCFIVAIVTSMTKHEHAVAAPPTSRSIPADPMPPVASGTAHAQLPRVDEAALVETPKESRPPPVTPHSAPPSPRPTARPAPSPPPPPPPTTRDSCASRGYWNARGIWKWKPECL